MTKHKYQLGDTLPSIYSNTGIHDQVRIATWECMIKFKYHYRETLSSENVNNRIHDQV